MLCCSKNPSFAMKTDLYKCTIYSFNFSRIFNSISLDETCNIPLKPDFDCDSLQG